MTYIMTPEVLPLDGWPQAMLEAREVVFESGDYRARGPLRWKNSGTPNSPIILRSAFTHGSMDGAPKLPTILLIHCDHVITSGLCWDNYLLWGSNFNTVENCSSYGGYVKMLDDASHNRVRSTLFHRLIDTGGDMPAFMFAGNWRWRYQNSHGRYGHRLSLDIKQWPENDFFPQRCWHNTLEDCVILNYVDGAAPAAIGGIGWLPWRNRATGTRIRNNIFGVTPDFVDSNNEWGGENIFCDCKSGGTKENPLLFEGNLISGQRKNNRNPICFAGTVHIGATNITFRKNIWTDCDSAMAVSFPRDETTTENGPWDEEDPQILFESNVFDSIYKTSNDTDRAYVKICGAVFSQGGTFHCTDSHFIKCGRLAVEYGRFNPSTFTRNKSYDEMDFNQKTGKIHNRAKWLEAGNQIIEGASALERRTKRIPWTDYTVSYTVPKGF